MKIRMIAAALCVAGCTHSPPMQDSLSPAQPRAVRNEIPFIPQEPRLCGPTVLKMAVGGLRPGATLEELKSMSFRESEQGAFKADMLAATRRLGLAPYRLRDGGAILRASAGGRPVIVFQNLGLSWSPVWHYALLVGYDADAGEVYLHSGVTANQPTPWREFHRTWAGGGQWSYQVTGPETLPDGAEFDEALDNAMIFESLRNPAAAELVLRAMTARWPDRYEPRLGLTNLFYHRGEKDRALREARQAYARGPGIPALAFNLGALYHETGRHDLALRMKEETLRVAPDGERRKYAERFAY